MNLRAMLSARHHSVRDLWFACVVLSWIGWIKVSGIIAVTVGNAVIARYGSISTVNAWASVPEQYKIVSFFEYAIEIAGALVLGLIALIFFVKRRRSVQGVPTVSREVALTLLVVALAVNLAVVRFGGLRGITLWSALALVLGFALVREATTLRIARVFGWTLPILASIGIIAFAVVPAIDGSVVLKNDYIEIPGKTRLPDGRVVVNQTYINTNHIDGFAIPDIMAPPGHRVDLDHYPHTEAPDSEFVHFLTSTSLQSFFYRNDTHTLYVHSNALPMVLAQAQHDAPDEDSANLVKALTFATHQKLTDERLQQADPSISNFIAINRYELAAQVQLGRFFYHHTYFFGPILSYSLGIPPKQISMLYGFGSTLSLAHLFKWMGGVTLDHYFTVFYAAYLAYALLVLITAALILSDRRYLCIIIVGLFGYLVLPGYEDFLQAPGFNPLRHWLDFVTFLCVFGFVRSRSRTMGLAVVVSSTLAIWWSAEFGVLGMISVFAGLLCAGLSDRAFRVRAAVIAALTAIAGILTIGYLHQFAAPNPTAVYSLIGVSMPVTDSHFVDLTASLVMLALVCVIGLLVYGQAASRRAQALASVGISASSYFVASLMYVVWYPSSHHLAPLAPSFALAFACLSKAMWVDHHASGNWERRVLAGAPAFLTLLLLPALVSFGVEFRHYHASTARHVVFDWKFDMLNARTTMDPAPFQRAVELMRKYEPSDRVVLLSKYSHLLPLLAARYNDVGLPEIESTLVSEREESIVENAVRRSHNRYIFVDSTIDDPMLGEIPDAQGVFSAMPGFVDQATGRVLALSVLKTVFDNVRSDYRLVETSPVLSVYERVGAANPGSASSTN